MENEMERKPNVRWELGLCRDYRDQSFPKSVLLKGFLE